MRYTIINFTRLGDLLQTQSTIAALKKSIHGIQEEAQKSADSYQILSKEPIKNNNNAISLICLEQFVSAAHFIEELDDISIFTSSLLLKSLHKDWRIAMQELETWVDAYYEKFPYDVIINLTPSMNCRVFAHLLSRKAPHIKLKGFGLDSFGYGQNSSVWTSYIQAVTKERGCSPYNLMDGFRSMLSLAPEPFHLKKPHQELQKSAHDFLEQERNLFYTKNTNLEMPDQKAGFIGFQLGASNEIRQWDIENFVHLGHMLWEQSYFPVLLGSPQEKALANAYIVASKKINPQAPIINLCGKTNLEELGALLTQMDALVSNDTGTLHLAVGLGTPVLGIYLATAQVFDTGPYGAGHLCLEPRLECHPCSFSHVCEFDNKCRKSIQPQSVFDTLTLLLNTKKQEVTQSANRTNISHTHTTSTLLGSGTLLTSNALQSKDARIWQAYFDESGFINYYSLSGDETSNRTLWMACQRLFYRTFLERFSHSEDIKNDTTSKDTLKTNSKCQEEILSLNAQNTSPLTYQNTSLSLKNKPQIQENIAFIERALTLMLLLKEQATMLKLRPSLKLQENFLSSMERMNTYLSQNSSFTALFLLWKNLIQEHSQSMETLIHFFDTLHNELSLFKAFLIKSSA